MIVVVASRHDRTATAMIEAWRGAARCSAMDLGRPGWSLELPGPTQVRWVVDGDVVDDADISGVCVRRSAVYADELVDVHRDDREYLAAETTAFLVSILSATAARVANRPVNGALGDAAIRPEQWTQLATTLGLQARPVPVTTDHPTVWPEGLVEAVTVVGARTSGGSSPKLETAARNLIAAAGLAYGRVGFDGDGRFVAASVQAGSDDIEALGHYLAGDEP